ncbi:MAG: hypothetical protein AB7S26_09705 [Sandaracinaceae bacterium]
MSTETTSQPQQTNPFFPPMPNLPAVPGMDMWKTMMEAQNERFVAMLGELERMETERHARTVKALEETTKLFTTSLEYQAKLAADARAQWRAMSEEAIRQGTAMFAANGE